MGTKAKNKVGQCSRATWGRPPPAWLLGLALAGCGPTFEQERLRDIAEDGGLPLRSAVNIKTPAIVLSSPSRRSPRMPTCSSTLASVTTAWEISPRRRRFTNNV